MSGPMTTGFLCCIPVQHWLVMAEKQVAWDECLIGMVQALTAALSCADLVVDSVQGRVVGCCRQDNGSGCDPLI